MSICIHFHSDYSHTLHTKQFFGVVPIHHHTVKVKHKRQSSRLELKYEARTRVSDRARSKERDRWQKKIEKAQEAVAADCVRWQHKLDTIDADLTKANDIMCKLKVNHRREVQSHIDNAIHAESQMKNYVDSLNDKNESMRQELKEALSFKRNAERLSARARRVAQARLEKWHVERFLRRAAEDEVFTQKQHAQDLALLHSNYKAMVRKDETTRLRMRKE